VAALKGHAGRVTSVTFSARQNLVAAGGIDGTIHVWDWPTGAEQRRIPAHRGFIYGVALSPDGERIISTSYDRTISLWDVKTERRLACYEVAPDPGEPGPIVLAQVNDAFPSRHAIGLVSGPNLGSAVIGVPSVTSPGSTAAAVFDPPVYELKILPSVSWQGGTAARTFAANQGSAHKRQAAGQPINPAISNFCRAAAAYRGDNTRFVAWNVDKKLRLFDGDGHRVADLSGHTGYLTSFAFSPGGDSVASASTDGSVLLWDADSGHRLDRFEHPAPVHSLAFSPDGKMLASGDGAGAVRLWAAGTRHPLWSVEAHAGPVVAVAFSPKGFAGGGPMIASAGVDGTIRFWDADRNEYARLNAETPMLGAGDIAQNWSKIAYAGVVDTRISLCNLSALEWPVGNCQTRAERRSGIRLNDFALDLTTPPVRGNEWLPWYVGIGLLFLVAIGVLVVWGCSRRKRSPA
jgi:WD40 repeat protein